MNIPPKEVMGNFVKALNAQRNVIQEGYLEVVYRHEV
jgi:hypothetical protein